MAPLWPSRIALTERFIKELESGCFACAGQDSLGTSGRSPVQTDLSIKEKLMISGTAASSHSNYDVRHLSVLAFLSLSWFHSWD